jgi:hypothetical protein
MRHTIQESLDTIDKLHSTRKIDVMKKQLAKIIKRCTPVEKSRAEITMSNPNSLGEDKLGDVILENVRRFKKFLKITVNPLSIAELVDKTESVNIKHIKFNNVFEKDAERPQKQHTDSSTQTIYDHTPLQVHTGPSINLHTEPQTKRRIVTPVVE